MTVLRPTPPTLSPDRPRRITARLALCAALATLAVGCQTPGEYRSEADEVAYRAIRQRQQNALGKTEPFTIDTPADSLRKRLMIEQDLAHAAPASMTSRDLDPIEQWPDDEYLSRDDADAEPAPWAVSSAPLRLKLIDALRIAARHSRDYQTQKERVFLAALRLDLEEDRFAGTLDSVLSSEVPIMLDNDSDRIVAGNENSATVGLDKRFKNGIAFATSLTVDLVRLLTMDRVSSMGIFADATVTIPLMRGSGEFVVTEPLKQADRDVVYAIYDFERFKRTFAVSIASDFLSVLQQQDQLTNARDNYERLISATRRARRLADAGRLPEIQVDQARQDELRARNRWISAQQSYERLLDQFKITLGLPTDAHIELAYDELDQLANAASARLLERATTQAESADAGAEPHAVAADAPITLEPPDRENAGPYELAEVDAIRLALDHRLDLRVAVGRIFDAQRGVAIAADDLRADVTLFGSASAGSRRSLGSARADDAELRPEEGNYSVLLTLDLPVERTAERNAYRGNLIDLEASVRSLQQLEDQIKLAVRSNLRTLLESRESLQIQAEAVRLAERRVESTDLFLNAGRAEIRDLLEAQEALISAQNALTSALVRYRVAELEMQRDLGLLEVNEQGLWQEWNPQGDSNGIEAIQ